MFRTREGGGVEDGEASKDASDEGLRDFNEKNENGLAVGGSICETAVFDMRLVGEVLGMIDCRL